MSILFRICQFSIGIALLISCADQSQIQIVVSNPSGYDRIFGDGASKCRGTGAGISYRSWASTV